MFQRMKKVTTMKRTTGTLLYLGLAILTLIPSAMAEEDWLCKLPCKCKWVSGKKTAECVRLNFTQIPDNLSSEIQILDLTGNRITYVNHDAFSRVNLVNLHKLVLRECGIKAVHTDAFNGLKIVIEIDLSGNNIKTLFPGTFVETQRLRVLLLNHNDLETLENGLFHDLSYLQKVVLSDNRLDRIGEKTFRNLPGLQTLTLDGNNLTSVRLSTFDNLPKLGSLELHNNPWNCNCHLKRFRDWTIERKLYTQPTTCAQPLNLAGKMWDELSSDDFACRPKITSIGPYPRIEAGQGDVKLWCRASGIPRPQMTWVFRARIISNSTRRYNNADRGYVIHEKYDWLNLTIPDVTVSDKGDYICMAKNPGGSIEKNVSLSIIGESQPGVTATVSLPLALGLGVTFLLLILVTIILCVWYCRKRTPRNDEKNAEAASLEHHGLGEQEKSLITAINPVVKPPRRYEAPSVTSHGTEMTELNRTLLDNDSVFGQYTAFITRQCAK